PDRGSLHATDPMHTPKESLEAVGLCDRRCHAAAMKNPAHRRSEAEDLQVRRRKQLSEAHLAIDIDKVGHRSAVAQSGLHIAKDREELAVRIVAGGTQASDNTASRRPAHARLDGCLIDGDLVSIWNPD